MTLSIIVALVFVVVSLACVIFSYDRQVKSSRIFAESLITANQELRDEIERLKKLPPPEKKVITIEAQQILHDMTAHGNSIIKITPLSPTDVFWRAPI